MCIVRLSRAWSDPAWRAWTGGRFGGSLVGVLLVAAVFALAPRAEGAVPSAQAAVACGTVYAVNQYGGSATLAVRARRVTCAAARKVVAAFFRKGGTAGNRVRMRHWSCAVVGYYDPGRPAFRCHRKGAPRKVATALWTAEGE